MIPNLNLLALGKHGSTMRWLRKVGPPQHSRRRNEVHRSRLALFGNIVTRLDNVRLSKQVLANLLPQIGGILSHGLVDIRLVCHAAGSGGSVKVEHSLEALPWAHATEPAQDSACWTEAAVIHDCCEEDLVHGDDEECD